MPGRHLPTSVVTLASLVLLLGGCEAEAEPAAAPAAAVDSPFPPSGMYEIAVHVIADDCRPAYVAPAPWRARVLVAAEGGRAKVNLPISALPPTASTTSSARSDFRLEPGYDVHRRVEPCAGFAIDYDYTLQRSSPTGFTLEVQADYGDGPACDATTPTKCTTTVEYVHTLAEQECAAECTRGQRPVTSGPTQGPVEWRVDCRCP